MKVKRYRITADVYALDGWRESGQEWLRDYLRSYLTDVFPLGVVEGYPDIQEIAQDSPFQESDGARLAGSAPAAGSSAPDGADHPSPGLPAHD